MVIKEIMGIRGTMETRVTMAIKETMVIKEIRETMEIKATTKAIDQTCLFIRLDKSKIHIPSIVFLLLYIIQFKNQTNP